MLSLTLGSSHTLGITLLLEVPLRRTASGSGMLSCAGPVHPTPFPGPTSRTPRRWGRGGEAAAAWRVRPQNPVPLTSRALPRPVTSRWPGAPGCRGSPQPLPPRLPRPRPATSPPPDRDSRAASGQGFLLRVWRQAWQRLFGAPEIWRAALRFPCAPSGPLRALGGQPLRRPRLGP